MAPFVESLAGAREPHRRPRHAVPEVLRRLFGGDAGDPDRREGRRRRRSTKPRRPQRACNDHRALEPNITEPAGRHSRPADGAVRFERAGWVAAQPSCAPAVIFMVVMFCYPLFYNIWMSLTDFRSRRSSPASRPSSVSTTTSTSSANKTFYSALWLTGIFTVDLDRGQMTIGMLLALFFWRSFPLNATMRALLLAPWLLPLVVSASVWQWMFQQDYGDHQLRPPAASGSSTARSRGWSNPTNALIAVIITNIWIGIPFSMAVFHSRPAGAAAGDPRSGRARRRRARCSASSSSSCRCSGR